MQLLDDDFLLDNDMAKTLYHDYAAQMPIAGAPRTLSV